MYPAAGNTFANTTVPAIGGMNAQQYEKNAAALYNNNNNAMVPPAAGNPAVLPVKQAAVTAAVVPRTQQQLKTVATPSQAATVTTTTQNARTQQVAKPKGVQQASATTTTTTAVVQKKPQQTKQVKKQQQSTTLIQQQQQQQHQPRKNQQVQQQQQTRLVDSVFHPMKPDFFTNGKFKIKKLKPNNIGEDSHIEASLYGEKLLIMPESKFFRKNSLQVNVPPDFSSRAVILTKRVRGKVVYTVYFLHLTTPDGQPAHLPLEIISRC
jgi:hypothetical protein